MKLPNQESALIEDVKITAYLLLEENSGGKAAFFTAFGFTVMNWEQLRDSLRQHVADHDVKSISETVHGVKYIIEGVMPTPDGRLPQVRSVRIIDAGKEAPRLVTAYPLEGEAS